jgi:signal transduction histidine kinase
MLLDYNHIETGRMTGTFIRDDLGKFVTDIVDLFVPVVESLGIKITVRTDHPVCPTWYMTRFCSRSSSPTSSRGTLKQSNSRIVAVGVDYEVGSDGDGWAHVAIMDPEVGIPIDAVDGAASTVTRDSTHTGLALNLAKEIIALHGGAITAKSGTKQSLDSASYNIRLPLGGPERDDITTPMGGTAVCAYAASGRRVVEAARGSDQYSQTDESSSIASASSHSHREVSSRASVSNRSQRSINPATDQSWQAAGLERRMAEQHRDVQKPRARRGQATAELFAGCISHEFGTPVNAILQCSSLVKDNLVALREHLAAQAQHGIRPISSSRSTTMSRR